MAAEYLVELCKNAKLKKNRQGLILTVHNNTGNIY